MISTVFDSAVAHDVDVIADWLEPPRLAGDRVAFRPSAQEIRRGLVSAVVLAPATGLITRAPRAPEMTVRTPNGWQR